MASTVRVMIEPGSRGKRFVAVAFDWPGWERSGKTERLALENLETYRARFRKVAEFAGLIDEFTSSGELQVVEYAEPSSGPDYFGISGRSATAELSRMTDAECERKMAILQGCWRYFDETHPRVSAELRKGPRGGGRDRDQIVRHTYFAEEDYARKVNVRTDLSSLETVEGIAAHRAAFLDAIRRVNAGEATRSSWTLQFTIRRACYHMLDHAWELEDKDLTSCQ